MMRKSARNEDEMKNPEEKSALPSVVSFLPTVEKSARLRSDCLPIT